MNPVIDCVGVCVGTEHKSNTLEKKKKEKSMEKKREKTENKCVQILSFGLNSFSGERGEEVTMKNTSAVWQRLEGLCVLLENFIT